MKITKQTKYTLDENEIKEAIRKHIIDKLGTEFNINEQDIVIDAMVDRDSNAHGFFAYATITDTTDTSDVLLDAKLI